MVSVSVCVCVWVWWWVEGQSSISDEADIDSEVRLHSFSCVPIESCVFVLVTFLSQLILTFFCSIHWVKVAVPVMFCKIGLHLE